MSILLNAKGFDISGQSCLPLAESGGQARSPPLRVAGRAVASRQNCVGDPKEAKTGDWSCMEAAHGLLGPEWVERKALMGGPEFSRQLLGEGALLMQALRHEDRHAEQGFW